MEGAQGAGEWNAEDREVVLSEDKAVEEPLEVRFSQNRTHLHPVPISRLSIGGRLFTVCRTPSKVPPGGMRQAKGLEELTNQPNRPVSHPHSTTYLQKPQTVITMHTHGRMSKELSCGPASGEGLSEVGEHSKKGGQRAL